MFVDILNQPDFSSYDISAMCGGGIGPRGPGQDWLSHLELHPIFYLGDKKVTIEMWVGGRQIPRAPGHQPKTNCQV